jgi:surfactin synthase thioesterase subunit
MSATIKENDAWVRRYHPIGRPGVRLACFPHAGGSASFYRPMSAALAGAVDVMALQYPGRQDRRTTPCVDSVDELAEQILEALLPWADEPFAFFGHSMGAVLAYEVAKRMEQRRLPSPVRLIVSGRRAPTRRRPARVHLLDDDGIVAELRSLSGSDPRVLGDEEMLRTILPAVRSDYAAIETYVCTDPAPVSCPVTVLSGDRDPQVTLDDAREWQSHARGGFSMHILRGGHFFLMEQPDEVIRIVRESLVGR